MLRLIGWGLLILGVIAATGLARGLAPTSRSVDLVEIVGQIEDGNAPTFNLHSLILLPTWMTLSSLNCTSSKLTGWLG